MCKVVILKRPLYVTESGTEAIGMGALDEVGEIQVWLVSGKFLQQEVK